MIIAIADLQPQDFEEGEDGYGVMPQLSPLLPQLRTCVRDEKADHAASLYDHAIGIAGTTRNVHLRHRLNKMSIDRQDVGHTINNEADRYPVDFSHDDGTAFTWRCALHAELAGKIDDGDHGAAQIHDPDHVFRSMWNSVSKVTSRESRGWSLS